MLHIVVLLIHLFLGVDKQSVLAKAVRFHFKRGIGSALSVLLLHALLASQSYSHLFLLLLAHELLLLDQLLLILDDHRLLDAVEVGLGDD